MKKYNRHNIALTDDKESQVKEVKNKTGKGITAIFKDGLEANLGQEINNTDKKEEEI